MRDLTKKCIEDIIKLGLSAKQVGDYVSPELVCLYNIGVYLRQEHKIEVEVTNNTVRYLYKVVSYSEKLGIWMTRGNGSGNTYIDALEKVTLIGLEILKLRLERNGTKNSN